MQYTDLPALRSYHDARGNMAWLEATEVEQAAALEAAIEFLDGRYGAGFGVGAGGFAGEVPTAVRFATAEAALAILTGESVDEEGIDAIVGGKEASVEETGDEPFDPATAKVDALKEWLARNNIEVPDGSLKADLQRLAFDAIAAGAPAVS